MLPTEFPIEEREDEDDEPYAYGYLFTVAGDRQGFYVEEWLEVSEYLGEGPKVAAVRAKFIPDRNLEAEARALQGRIRAMALKVRFNSQRHTRGPCLVKAQQPLTPEIVEAHIANQQDKEAFFRKSRI